MILSFGLALACATPCAPPVLLQASPLDAPALDRFGPGSPLVVARSHPDSPRDEFFQSQGASIVVYDRTQLVAAVEAGFGTCVAPAVTDDLIDLGATPALIQQELTRPGGEDLVPCAIEHIVLTAPDPSGSAAGPRGTERAPENRTRDPRPPAGFAVDALLVAGGDYGLFRARHDGVAYGPLEAIDTSDSSCPDALGSKWCFDVVAVDEAVVALWSAKGRSELRLYSLPAFEAGVGGTWDPEAPPLIKTIHLSPAGPADPPGLAPAIGPPGIGYALAVEGEYAYVAMGAGGLYRVDLRTNVVGPAGYCGAPVVTGGGVLQGKFRPTSPGPDGDVLDLNTFRDLEIRNGILYAAADINGLVAVDLSLYDWTRPHYDQPDAAIRRFASSCGPLSYVVRVATEILDDGRTLVVAGRGRGPVRFHEGGPWAPWGNYGPPLRPGGFLNDVRAPDSCRGLDFFVNEGGTQLVQIAERSFDEPSLDPCCIVQGGDAHFWWQDLAFLDADFDAVPPRLLLTDEELMAWRIESPGDPMSLAIDAHALPFFARRRPDSTSVRVSLGDPDLLLLGSDGRPTPSGLLRIEPSPPGVELREVPGTFDGPVGVGTAEDHDDAPLDPDRTFNFGLLVGAQWRDARGGPFENVEYIVSAVPWACPNSWRITRFDATSAGTLLDTTDHWQLPFPTGFPYRGGGFSNSIAIQTRAGDPPLLFAGRGRIRRGIAVFDTAAVVAEIERVEGGPGADDPNVDPGEVRGEFLNGARLVAGKEVPGCTDVGLPPAPGDPAWDTCGFPAALCGSIDAAPWLSAGCYAPPQLRSTRASDPPLLTPETNDLEALRLGARTILAVSQGSNFLQGERLRVAFFDVTDWHFTASGALVDASGTPADTLEPVVGETADAGLGFGLEMFDFDGDVVAIVTDTFGRVVVFALPGLSSSRGPFSAQHLPDLDWDFLPNLFDGRPDTPVEVELQPLDGPGPTRVRVFVACSRLGLAERVLARTGRGAFELGWEAPATIHPTPGQVADVYLQNGQSPTGGPRLIVADHSEFGPRVYGE